ncbi:MULTISPECIES: divisome-associated lipoprotein DalA [unclassified Roseivivax]|uniref:CAP domain-containing protein n=1 Tax=Roseivivax sp. GX 12232 TaxID=2900547 RepID=UPI001E4B08DF|nr:CAP domain-containing protein [Roseivivax sp. GX 12232]MCE0506341.1 CAP domain-containing protein [Roseivivax sp. GX 12232]
MLRASLISAALALVLAGCASSPTPPAEPRLGPDGQPLPTVYRIGLGEANRIEIRMLDSVNALRAEQGLVPLEYNAQLNAAAATHSRDMAVQNRPWHFGSDGSSPIDRVRRVGYGGSLQGEVISETYETELQTLAAWMDDSATRGVIMSPEAREMGFAWHQENNGKIWWTLITGAPGSASGAQVAAAAEAGGAS